MKLDCGHEQTWGWRCYTCDRTRCGNCFPCHEADGTENETFKHLRETYPEDYPEPEAKK